MHNNVKFVLRDDDIQVLWGQLQGIPIYLRGEHLCLSACPGNGEVIKNCRPPLPKDNFWNSP